MKNGCKCLILTTEGLKDRFIRVAKDEGLSSDNFIFVYDRKGLDNFFQTSPSFEYLISFSTSIVVPEQYLIIPDNGSVNIHAGSPEYPGRDPHHYAIYDDATIYGATMHYMTKRVDDGAIIDVDLFSIEAPITPQELMYRADSSAWNIIKKLFFWIKNDMKFPISSYSWKGKKRSRKDFQNFCKIEFDITQEELDKRIRSFHVDGFKNLYVEVHNQKFYL